MSRRSKENFLDYVPVISPRHTWSAEEGQVTVHMEHRGFFPWVAQTFFARPRVSHIRLDAPGSFVYRHIDGRRTVEELAQLVHQAFGAEAEPLYDRLVQYLRILHNNGFITYQRKGE